MGVRLKAISAGTMGGARIGGAAGGFEGFTHTWKGLDCLKVEDELDQVTHPHHTATTTSFGCGMHEHSRLYLIS